MLVLKIELLVWGREVWLISLWSISICSLLKGLVSVWLGLVATALWAQPSLSLNGLDGFQSVGLQWIFQQFSLVCTGFQQRSHQGLLFFWLFSLLTFNGGPCTARADLSRDGIEFWNPIITFFVLSSRRTSENAFQILGRGLVPMTLPLTSSRFLLRPGRNLKVRFCSTIFWYSAVSSGHFQVWTSNISSCCQWWERV